MMVPKEEKEKGNTSKKNKRGENAAKTKTKEQEAKFMADLYSKMVIQKKPS
jgi:hypothetical protein